MIVGCGRLIAFSPTLNAIHEDMNCMKVWSLDDREDIDGISRNKEDKRMSRLKREDYVLELGPVGLEVTVMNQIWVFGNKVLEIRKNIRIRGLVL